MTSTKLGGVSRQRRWQIKQVANGRCKICAKPAVTKHHCKKHARDNVRRHLEWARKPNGRKYMQDYLKAWRTANPNYMREYMRKYRLRQLEGGK